MSSKQQRTWMIGVIVAGLVTAAVALGAGAREKAPAAPERFGEAATAITPEPVAAPVVAAAAEAPAAPQVPEKFVMPMCDAVAASTEGGAVHERVVDGDPRARKAAQKGLDFLARQSKAWQNANNCYGCHVQAVTMEAFAVGVHHQYDVKPGNVKAVLGGMLRLSGGAHRAGGIGYEGDDSISRSAKVMGAAAFARYDQWIGQDLTKILLAEAKRVKRMQYKSGAVPMPYSQAPVLTDEVQGTALAIVTWKQAYERTADDEWLTAIQKAEDYLTARVAKWTGKYGPASIQDLDYAIIGLVTAGVSPTEDSLGRLAGQLLARQRPDGGWALTMGGASEAFATGQALYTLRLLGMTDQDEPVAKGTRWLINKQGADGGWSHHGFGKAEAMWGVLGLVSMDVLTVAVTGVQEGQRVSGETSVSISASDNSGSQVTKLEVFVDDLPAAGACAPSMTWSWATAGLSTGRHVVEVRATNAKGAVSRRRLEVFAGDVYLTQLGSRWSDGGTEISARDIADPGAAHQVTLEVLGEGGAVVHSETVAGKQGALAFRYAGGKPGKRTARLSYKDADGKVRQTAELPFVHDTPEAQRRQFGQVSGGLKLAGGARGAGAGANVEVELVDDAGNVVQRTNSTSSGQFRFKNVDPDKKYQVRVRKDGYAAPPAAAAPMKAGEASVDLELKAE